MNLGRLGVWSSGLRATDEPKVLDAAAELEDIGYSSIWFPAGRGLRAVEVGRALLAAARAGTVASGILSLWDTSAEQADRGFVELDELAPGRFLLGIGV